MAKAVKRKSSRTVKKTFVSPFNIYWDKTNYILLIAGMLFVFLGFFLMSRGEWDSTTSLILSPIILFIGYVIIFPLSILFRKKEMAKVIEQKPEQE